MEKSYFYVLKICIIEFFWKCLNWLNPSVKGTVYSINGTVYCIKGTVYWIKELYIVLKGQLIVLRTVYSIKGTVSMFFYRSLN